ncbi:MAG: urea transport system permease protein [Frankiaceae bacterium]|nr:urea transport system permease protein [Frankiaceae bacterium]
MTLSSSWRGRLLFAAAAAALLLVAPSVLSDFRLGLLGKYLCFAIVAAGIGLAWGRGGMLLLGQGIFFGLGAYAMAMHLKLAAAGPGGVPDFMKLYGDGGLPWWWAPFRHTWFALPMTVLLPMALAAGIGSLIFRRRVRGPYFAILSQALSAAFVVLLIGFQKTTGGTNGLTNIRDFFGFDLDDPVNRKTIYLVTAVVLLLVFLLVRQLSQSRLGQLLIATRDAEERVRFLGYDPANVKLVAYVAAAGLAGLAGALYVPVFGSINPSSLDIIPSIEFVIAVAIGGRASLSGPILGAIFLGYSKTSLSEMSRFANGKWIYPLGGLFIFVVAFFPDGLASVGGVIRRAVRRQDTDAHTSIPRQGEPAGAVATSGAAP